VVYTTTGQEGDRTLGILNEQNVNNALNIKIKLCYYFMDTPPSI